MIPIGGGYVNRSTIVSWENVSWTGQTLLAGMTAAQKAIECLDAAAVD